MELASGFQPLRFTDVLGHGKNLSVLFDCELSTVAPTPAFNHALATRSSNSTPKLGIVEPAPNGGRECFSVASWTREHRLAVGTSDLG
jgi:hypothetical protein